MSYQPPPGQGYPQQGWSGPPQQGGGPPPMGPGQFGPPVQWGGPPPGPPRRGGAPWWSVAVLGVAVVALAAGLLVVLLTGGSNGSTEAVELPDEVDGIELADEQGVDRPATRKAILKDTGVAGDVAMYEDDGDEVTVYLLRKESIGNYETVPADEDDEPVFKVQKRGEVRCNVQIADDDDEDQEDRTYGCARTGPDLTIQVGSSDFSQDRQVKIVDELWDEFS